MQLGVRRGQRLLALSDPLRYGQMWSLLDRPSLRFVIDTFKMRRSSPIDLAFEPMLGAAGGCGSGRRGDLRGLGWERHRDDPAGRLSIMRWDAGTETRQLAAHSPLRL